MSLEEEVNNLQLNDTEVVSEPESSDFSDFSDSEDDSKPSEGINTTQQNPTKSSSTTDKAKILSKYSDKIKTDEFLFKQKHINKDKADRATVENVLDPRTISFIVKLIKKGTITKINGCLSTGKEANVYHAENENTGKEYALKVYKTSILVFKDRERYVDGEFRFRNSRSQHNPRKMIKIWAEKEFRNLKRLHTNGMYSPEPVDLKSHVLLMEFLSNGDGFPSPKLRDYPYKDFEEIMKFYHEMLYSIRFMFQVCRLVHADLSEYNSIVHDGKLYIFDVSQSVEPEHPMSLDFLRMDIKNVNDFFMRKGIDVVSERLIFKYVIEDINTLKMEDDSKESNFKYIKNLPLKSENGDDEMNDDEVFRNLHLVRSLNHLEERDFEKFSDGKIDTMKSLVGDEAGMFEDEDESEDDDSDESDSDDDEGDEDDDDETEGKKKKVWKEKIVELKGKKYEDKDEKKERKQKAREDAKEKRKTKMKKHVKKKLVNKGKSK
jgi:RIO kinase 1